MGWRRVALVALALVGIGIAGYLSYAKLSGSKILCVGDPAAHDVFTELFKGCEDVSNSRWGEWVITAGGIGGPAGLHIPTAAMGLLLYVTLLGLLVVPLGRWRPAVDWLIFGLAFAGVLYSAYLTYIEIWVLVKLCPWCIGSALTVTGMWLLAWPRTAS